MENQGGFRVQTVRRSVWSSGCTARRVCKTRGKLLRCGQRYGGGLGSNTEAFYGRGLHGRAPLFPTDGAVHLSNYPIHFEPRSKFAPCFDRWLYVAHASVYVEFTAELMDTKKSVAGVPQVRSPQNVLVLRREACYDTDSTVWPRLFITGGASQLRSYSPSSVPTLFSAVDLGHGVADQVCTRPIFFKKAVNGWEYWAPRARVFRNVRVHLYRRGMRLGLP